MSTGRYNNLPPHGTRRRNQTIGCRCVACSRLGVKDPGKIPTDLRWPYKWLQRRLGAEQIEAWYSPEVISEWRSIGLGDFEADEVCVRFGILPHEVFPGYTEAGLDSDVYP